MHILCLQCFLNSCYDTVHRDQPQTQGHPCGLVSTGQCHHLPYWVPQNAVSWALTPNTEHLPLGLFMSVDASCIVWEFQTLHSAEVTLQTVTYLCFAGLQKSREAWEQPSKSGTSKWCFIWLLIRTIPLYLRDCNCHSRSRPTGSKFKGACSMDGCGV